MVLPLTVRPGNLKGYGTLERMAGKVAGLQPIQRLGQTAGLRTQPIPVGPGFQRLTGLLGRQDKGEQQRRDFQIPLQSPPLQRTAAEGTGRVGALGMQQGRAAAGAAVQRRTCIPELLPNPGPMAFLPILRLEKRLPDFGGTAAEQTMIVLPVHVIGGFRPAMDTAHRKRREIRIQLFTWQVHGRSSHNRRPAPANPTNSIRFRQR